jgi:hypothetical protein
MDFPRQQIILHQVKIIDESEICNEGKLKRTISPSQLFPRNQPIQ